MNNLTINGNLVRDMEIKDVKGLLIGEFTIANNQRVSKDKEETTFLKCTLFGSRVEALEKFLVKRVLLNSQSNGFIFPENLKSFPLFDKNSPVKWFVS